MRDAGSQKFQNPTTYTFLLPAGAVGLGNVPKGKDKWLIGHINFL